MTGKVASTVVLAVIAVICVAAVVLGIYVNTMDTIYPKVTMDGVSVGGMSISDAAEKIDTEGAEYYSSVSVTVSLPLDYSIVIDSETAGIATDAYSAAEIAYNYGRDGNVVTNLFSFLKCAVVGTELSGNDGIALSEEAIRAKIESVTTELTIAMMGSNINITEDAVEITKGVTMVSVDNNEIYDMIEVAFMNGDYGTLVYEPETSGTAELDVEQIHELIFVDVQDAVYDPETYSATEHTVGISFDMQQAQQMWESAGPGEVVVIPLIRTQPEMTTDYLNSILFADELAQKTTTLTYDSNRNTNIRIAGETIDGLILNPGEEFSFNDVVGQRTADKGYKYAGAYSNGEVIESIGGGICQVSSTIYYCALLSNLKITNRTCHYFSVSYLPLGLDATVSWGAPEFKFVNSREYPIRIDVETDVNARTVSVKVYGTDVDGSYVQMATETWATASAFGATSYRLVYDADGNLISRTKEADSTYHYHKSDEGEASPSPGNEVSPSPSGEESPSPSGEESPSPSGEESPSPSGEESSSPGGEASPSPSGDESQIFGE